MKSAQGTVLVWDWPVRVGHWALVGAFALAWLTSEREAWRLVHVGAGAVLVAVILFRLVWGLIGTRHARFSSFIRGPQAVLAYLRGLSRGDPVVYAGHNAAGGWAIVALLLLGLLTGVSGWATYQDLGGKWLEEAHEVLASTLLAVALLHVCGVLASSLAHRENLVRAMLSGFKRGRPEEGIERSHAAVVVILLGWVVFCVWLLAR